MKSKRAAQIFDGSAKYNPMGMWMYHCHILEHHEAGMMANFEVIDPVVGELHTGQHCHAQNF
jgi:hypothetical protein